MLPGERPRKTSQFVTPEPWYDGAAIWTTQSPTAPSSTTGPTSTTPHVTTAAQAIQTELPRTGLPASLLIGAGVLLVVGLALVSASGARASTRVLSRETSRDTTGLVDGTEVAGK